MQGKLRPRGHGARVLAEARRELRMYGRGEVMCSVGAPGCGTRPLFYPRDGGVRIRGINA